MERILEDLKLRVESKKRAAADHYLETGKQEFYVEGQRALGAEWILEELTRRIHYCDPQTPEWSKRTLTPREVQFRI